MTNHTCTHNKFCTYDCPNKINDVSDYMKGQRKVWGDIRFMLDTFSDKELRSSFEDYLKRNK